MVAESTGKGVIPVTASNHIKNYHGVVHLYRYNQPISDQQRQSIVNYVQEEFGKEYPRPWKFIKFLKDPDRKDNFITSVTRFCSELVSAVYNRAGLDLRKKIADSHTTPGHLSDSPFLDPVCVIEP